MNRSELFKKLESYRYTTGKNYQYSMFTQTPKNTEYWLASDLEKLFGIENMPWHDDMNDAMCKIMEHRPDAPFYEHVIPITSPAGQKTYDMKLSRVAAWILAAQNPRMAFTCAYFMMPGGNVSTISNMADNLTRLNNHNKLTQYNRLIAGILKRDNIPFFRFYTDLHDAFFGTANTDTIKAQNGIRIIARDSIHNYMGAASMGEMANGMDTIICRYDNNGRRGLDTLSHITVQEMKKARDNMINKTGRVPARDIEKMHIKDLRLIVRNIECAFIQKFKFETLREYTK